MPVGGGSCRGAADHSGGNGWYTQNLLRKPVGVWPTEPPKQPGVLDLWVADQGSLSGAVPPWPLLAEGVTDYFKGVPVAMSQRGEPITGPRPRTDPPAADAALPGGSAPPKADREGAGAASTSFTSQ